MRRLAGILLVAIVAAVTPLTADLTITTVTTIEGAMMSAAPGGLTPFGSSYLGFFRLSLYALLTLVLTPVQIVVLLVAFGRCHRRCGLFLRRSW